MPHNKNKRNKRKFLRDVNISKTKGRQIIVRGKPVSPIRAATAIKGDSLYSDSNYVLRDSFEFDIDKDNERNGVGIIISREDVDDWKLELASARYIFEQDMTERFTDVKFTELEKAEAPVYGTPIIDQFEYENVTFREANKEKGGGWRLAYDLGEPHILDMGANDTLVMVVNAFNYEDKKGRKNRENLQYTWYFSAEPKRNFDTDVQNKVIAKGRKLSIYNIQRSGTGRYMCEVTNDKGVSRTIAQFVSVWRPGRIKEMMGGAEKDIPLGKFEWEDTNKSYDKQKPPTRPFMNYDLEQEKWVRLRFNPETKEYESADAVSPGRAVNKRPWNFNRKIDWIKKNSMKGNTISSKQQRKQGYWRIAGDSTVYWSDSGDVYRFLPPQEQGVDQFERGRRLETYYNHREEMGYERDFSEIENLSPNSPNPYLTDGEDINDIIVYYG
mgnify:FL=1